MPLLEKHPNLVLLIIFILCEFFAISALATLTVVLVKYMGGASVAEKPGEEEIDYVERLWNLHSILMCFAFIFCMGNGLVMFRLFRLYDLRKVKWAHLIFMLGALIFGIVGLVVGIVGNHKHKGFHFHTLHDWFGLFVMFVFVMEFIMSIPIFVFKIASAAATEFHASIHAFFGVFCFLLAMVVTCMAVGRKNLFVVEQYGPFAWQAMLINYTGCATIIFTSLVFYISVNPFFEYPKVCYTFKFEKSNGSWN